MRGRRGNRYGLPMPTGRTGRTGRKRRRVRRRRLKLTDAELAFIFFGILAVLVASAMLYGLTLPDPVESSEGQ